jgi:hypothetical protein
VVGLQPRLQSQGEGHSGFPDGKSTICKVLGLQPRLQSEGEGHSGFPNILASSQDEGEGHWDFPTSLAYLTLGHYIIKIHNKIQNSDLGLEQSTSL